MRFLFANPVDVAYADQEAASRTGTIVRVVEQVPPGLMYLVHEERLRDAAHGVELKRIAEEVIEVKTSNPPGSE